MSFSVPSGLRVGPPRPRITPHTRKVTSNTTPLPVNEAVGQKLQADSTPSANIRPTSSSPVKTPGKRRRPSIEGSPSVVLEHPSNKKKHLQAEDPLLQPLLTIALLDAGLSAPWVAPTPAQVQELLKSILPGTYVDAEKLDNYTKKVSIRHGDWQRGFAVAAAQAVRNYLVIQTGNRLSDQKRARDLVHSLMKPVHNALPFLWAKWELDASGAPKKSGRFRHPLILETFARAYFVQYLNLLDPLELSKFERPIGALVLSIQAVSHALDAWETGIFRDNLPSFIAEKYADVVVEYSSWDEIQSRASFYVDYVDKLVERDWFDIFSESARILNVKRLVVTVKPEYNIDSD